MLFYDLFIFLLIFLAFRYIGVIKIKDLGNWTFSFAYLIKVLAGIFFIFIYSVHYGRGALSADAGAFMRESRIVYDVFSISPIDYLKLLTGIGESKEIIHHYLSQTNHWDVGNLTLINDSKNVLRVHSLIHFISFHRETVHMLIIAAVSLLSTKHLYLTFKRFTSLNPIPFFWILILVPSTLFWTSGILKEPFMFLGITLLLRAFIDNSMHKVRKILFGLLGLLLSFMFKPYILFCAIPAFLFYLILKYISRGKVIVASLGFLTIICGAYVVIPSLTKNVVHYISRKQFDFNNVGKGGIHVLSDSLYYYFTPDQNKLLRYDHSDVYLTEPTDAFIIYFGKVNRPIPVKLKPNTKPWKLAFHSVGCESYIEPTLILEDPAQMIKNIPEAFSFSMLRPFPTDKGSWLKFPSFIELWLIFFVFAFSILRRRSISFDEKNIYFSLVVFALALFLLIGWTTPVIGAIARYRFPAQLALVLAACIIIDPKKIFKHE